MRSNGWSAVACALTMVVLGAAAPASGQATRTWVSGIGDDANPCSRTAPCKTFAGAISKTAAGGEIDALDPGGFGAVTITKSLTLDGTGTLAGILASGVNGVIVNAGATDRVVLRGIQINGSGTPLGLNGVQFRAGGRLYVEGCTIANFSGFGIDVQSSGRIYLSDTTIAEAAGGAVSIVPATGTSRVTLDGMRLHQGAFGLHAKGNAVVTVRNSIASGNDGPGFWAETAPAELNIDGSTAASNDTGIRASDAAIVRTTGVTVTGNTTAGLLAESGGQLIPFTDNQIAGNPPAGGGAAACQLDTATAAAAIACPSTAVCQAPIIQSVLGPCRRCRTRAHVTTCASCPVTIQ